MWRGGGGGGKGQAIARLFSTKAQENIVGTTGGVVVVINLCYYLPLGFSSIPNGIYMLGRARNVAFETDPV